MRPADNIEKLIKKLRYKSSAETHDRVLGNVLQALENREKPAATQPNIWRKIMKSRVTKFAAAAVIIIAVALSLTLFENSIPTAYALEQTIQASHSVQYLHIKSFMVSISDEPIKCWVEFDPSGRIKNMRINKPAWMSPADGVTVVVWKDNKAQIWTKKKGYLVTITDEKSAAEMLRMVEQLDPKHAVANIQQIQAQVQDQDNIKIEIDEPQDKAEPVVITVTLLEKNDFPFQRVILFVDQATKLLNSVETYLLKDGKYIHFSTIEFYDYNQPIDSKMFSFDDVPADVIRIDQTTQEIGLVKGDLTENEIAVKIVREFYEALIVKDYAKAGRLYCNIPAARMREMFAEFNVVQIISISEPIPYPSPGVGGFQVPCKIEIEKDGVKSVYEPYGPGVRPVRGQPDRWNIHGGVK